MTELGNLAGSRRRQALAEKKRNLTLGGVDALFSTEEDRQAEKLEKVQEIPVDKLIPFKNHPFKVVDDEAMLRTVESVSQYGVLAPLIARPREDGSYELISGHRRKHAAELAGMTAVPVIVREMDDDAATILMVDSNLQRETILPSERAWAYRLKLEAMKHQGDRGETTSRQLGEKSWSVTKISQDANESERQVHRFIRLTYLIPELLEMVDQKQLAFNPAVELSYLSEEQQNQFIEAMEYAQTTPSLSQAQRLKKLAADGMCSLEAMCAVMSEEKKDMLDKVTFKGDELRKFFPKSYTPKQMQETIIKLLTQWQKKRERDMSL
jgi:ParB family chromosome partitioning protein